MSLDCPEGYEPFEGKCPYCGADSFVDYRENTPHVSVFCVNCGKFIKHISKENIDKWKKEVKQRDKYTCQRCGKTLTPRTTDAHHKMPVWFMPELKTNLDNGITLCKACHKQLHGVGGTIRETEGGEK